MVFQEFYPYTCEIWKSYMRLQEPVGYFQTTKCCANEKDFKNNNYYYLNKALLMWV
jgi:hypothetical protein